MNPVHTSTFISFLILSSHLFLYIQSDLLRSDFQFIKVNSFTIFPFSATCYMPCSSLPNSIWSRVQIKTLLIVKCYPPPPPFCSFLSFLSLFFETNSIARCKHIWLAFCNNVKADFSTLWIIFLGFLKARLERATLSHTLADSLSPFCAAHCSQVR
jgi:hypothetical protein